MGITYTGVYQRANRDEGLQNLGSPVLLETPDCASCLADHLTRRQPAPRRVAFDPGVGEGLRPAAEGSKV